MRRLIRNLLLTGLSAVAPWGATASAASPLFENSDVIAAPMIDAVRVINRGTINVTSDNQPYDTQNTLYLTNFQGAVIQGTGGVRFDLVDTNGFRHPSSTFYNAGLIRMDSASFSFAGVPGGTIFGGFYPNSWILIEATNIVNRGGLAVGASGLMNFKGENVQFSRSGFRAGEDPTTPINEGFTFDTQYTTDSGVQDLYAGVGVNNAIDPATPGPYRLAALGGNPASSDFHQVILPSGFTNRVNVAGGKGFALTNKISDTNFLVQLIYVDTNSLDPNFKVAYKWGAPRVSDVPAAKMAMVQFTYTDVDTITGEPITNFVYVLDWLGATSNAIFHTNFVSTNLLRPSTLMVTRVTPPEWRAGVGTNVVYSSALLSGPTLLATEVTNVYAAYGANIGNEERAAILGGPFGSSNLPGFLTHPTNAPGRIEIDAENLDLGLARIRSEGLLTVKAAHLAARPPYLVDSPYVNYDVGSTNGLLVVSNLVETTVRRFKGQVFCWSGAWTNQTTSVGPDPADPTLKVTNTIDIRYQALVVQHAFETIVPVETIAFTGHGTQIDLWDDLALTDAFAFDTESLTIRSNVTTGSLPWDAERLPRLKHLLLNGQISTTDQMKFGSGDVRMSTITNTGAMSAPYISIRTDSLDNSGTIASGVANLDVEAGSARLAGTLRAGANWRLTGKNVISDGAKVVTGTGSFGTMVLDVSDSFVDGGTNAPSTWRTTDGIELVRKPTTSSLLGTEVVSFLNRFRNGFHVWAADDLGATAAGFQNNAAIGKLTLDGTPFTLFSFVGPDTQKSYAMYVEYLNLTNSATDVELALEIAPNFTLYFADASVPGDQLDGALGGRLRWVKDFAGANSSANVTLSNGKTAVVNRALLRSTLLDSDGDGIVNALDASPFEPAALKANVRILGHSPAKAEVSWLGRPGGSYRVEYSSRLDGTGWQVLETVVNPEDSSGAARVLDSVVSPSEQRFYRVVEVR